jgi:hypothetical protein
MNLSEAGESRIRGYLFMLESSLRTFLKRDVAADAVREVESHIRERVRETDAMPNERDALNRLLDALGPPHRLARAYSAEMAADEAISSGRLGAIAMALLAVARNTVEGFAVAVALLVGYILSVGLLLVAIAKPIFPNNVGVHWVNGEFRGAGWELSLAPNAVVTHGWWVMLICAVLGTILLWTTHRGTRRYLRRVSQRRQHRIAPGIVS